MCMNYYKLYNTIIQNSQLKNRKKNCGIYYENHHILPKSLGGNNESNNLILLTAKEHFICHHLLTKIYPHNSDLIFAFWAMCNQKTGDVERTYKISPRIYEKAKENFSIVNSKLHKGKKLSIDHKQKISNFLKNNNPNKNKFGEKHHNSEQYQIQYHDKTIVNIIGLQNFAKKNGYNRRSLYKLMNGEIKFHHNIISIKKIV
jgi:hypothetical protein